MVGKTIDQVTGIAVTEDGKAGDADLASSVTMSIGGYLDGIQQAVANAQHLGASKGDTLVLTSTTSLTDSKDATAEEDGLAQAYATVGAITMNGDTITSMVIDAVQANVNFDAAGQITTGLTAAQPSKNQLGDDYGMRKASSIGKEWYEQAAGFAAYAIGKTPAEVSGIAVTEDGKAADADLAASVTISIGAAGCAGTPAATPSPGLPRYEATFLTLFDTVTTIKGYAADEAGFQAMAQEIHDGLLEYHQLYDIYNEYPGVVNLKTVNDAAGGPPVKVEQPILDLLLFCREVYTETEGRVNAAMGSVLSLWHEAREAGINDPEHAALPDRAALEEAALHTDFSAVVIDEEASTVQITDPETRLDVGAIAKGYAGRPPPACWSAWAATSGPPAPRRTVSPGWWASSPPTEMERNSCTHWSSARARW